MPVIKAMQGIANDHPEIAQGVFKNCENLIGETGFEPATLVLPKHPHQQGYS